VLLSVVAQAFALIIFIYLCAGEDVPPSGDADKGYQWEVQTDEDWVPYWDFQAYVIRWSSLPFRAKGVCLI
jgi:hypothetical protein